MCNIATTMIYPVGSSLCTSVRLPVEPQKRQGPLFLWYGEQAVQSNTTFQSEVDFHVNAKYPSPNSIIPERANKKVRLALAERDEIRSRLCDIIRIQRLIKASFPTQQGTGSKVIRKIHVYMALSKRSLSIFIALLIFYSRALSLSVTPAVPPKYSVAHGNVSSSPLKPRCTDSREWIGGGYNAEDCASALRLLFWTEVRSRPLEPFEFLAAGDIPTSRHSVVVTPKRYTRGTCTVAIVMLEFFARAGLVLPDQTPYILSPKSDVATWQSLWGAATRIRARCGEANVMGWDARGNEGGIGLFVWATGSGMDKSVP